MSTLSEQLERQNQQRIHKFNEVHYEWLNQFQNYFTHALTLTFHPMRIRHLQNKSNKKFAEARADILDLEKRSFRYFANRLDRGLFGNASARHGNKLLLVPVLEGLFEDGRPHYHCALGIPRDRFDVIGAKVREAWKETPLAGNQIDVQPYRNSGWLGYMSKQSKYINRESIDWGNVRVPNSFPFTAE